MQRHPWCFFLILSNHKTVFGGIADHPHVLDSLSRSADVLDDQFNDASAIRDRRSPPDPESLACLQEE